MFMSACLAAFLSYLALGNIESPEGIFGCVLVCALPYHICCSLTHTPSHPHTVLPGQGYSSAGAEAGGALSLLP